MKTVWKFHLSPTGFDHSISLPADAEITRVAEQHGGLFVWVLLDPKAPQVKRRFRYYATGEDIPEPEKLKFIGTALQLSGTFVWHLFEVLDG